MPAAGERSHDIVLFGATGFTGGLTAEYLAQNADEGTKWAIAGRNRAKLEALRDRLAAGFGARGDLPLLECDVNDPASLRAVAESTRVVITTVGPYINYGEPLVAACAQAGTDYTDLTGEPEFVDLMYVRHQAKALETGARLVHACGFDSIPHDLGAQFTVEHLPEGVPIELRGFVSAGGKPSAGTFHSAVTGFSRVRQFQKAAAERRKLEQRPTDRKIRGSRQKPYREREVDAWAVPLPTIDPQIILRSARALGRYGPDFTYGHFAAVKRLPYVIAGAAGIASVFALAQLPPTRKLLLSRMESGEGPSPEERAKSWFKVTFVGSGGGVKVTTEVSGGDPGYGETSKMLAESALCLAHDSLPGTAGQVTTAQAMGKPLRERLQRRGIDFRVL